METKHKLRSLAQKGNPKHLKKFLSETNSKAIHQRINETVDSTGATPLIECVKSAGRTVCHPGEGFGLCCRTLTKCGSNINYRDRTERTSLHWAVLNKNASLTTILVGLGADCKFRDKDGLNPFHVATRSGTTDCVVNMLKLNPEIVDVLDSSGVPPIIMSLQKGEYEMCRLLFKEGADINVPEKRSQRTALYYALFLKQFALFEDMLTRADINLADHRLTTIIHRCCAVPDLAFLAAVFKLKTDIPVSMLDMQDSEGCTAVATSCQNGNYDHLQMLVERGASVSTRDKCIRTALHHCADNFDTQCAELLLGIDPSLLNIEDHEGLTALHLAVITGNIPLIRVLLKRGADLTCQDFEKHTVAHWATVRGLSEVLKILIDYGADILTPDSNNAYPLHYAAQIVQSDDAELETFEDGTDVLRLLLKHGSPVNAADDDGRTPLLWAASSGNIAACQVFIDAGADIYAVDKNGLTALHCAASRGHHLTTKCLVKDCKIKVDTVDSNNCTALFYAITLGNIECMKLLIDLGANLSHLDARGRTPAHCAAVKGSVEALELLHKRNVSLWKASHKGDLPIHEAAQAGHVDVVDFLLKNITDDQSPNVVNNDGRSCLHLAALTNNVWLCKRLIDANCNINIIMKTKGKYYTPYDAAVIKDNKESADYIKSKGGRSGNDITQGAARVIQKNFRSKYIRPKSAKPRPKSTLLDPRRRSISPLPYSRERRLSFRHDDSGSDRGSQEFRSASRLSVIHFDETRNRQRKISTDSNRKSMGSSASKTKDTKQDLTIRVPGSPIPSAEKSPNTTHVQTPANTKPNDELKTKSRKVSDGSCDSGPKVKQTVRKSKLLEEVQASVRRFEAERKYIRELHQIRRAQLYMGPMYDIGLYKHMQNETYRPKTGNGAGDENGSLHSLSQWDDFVQDQCKFVSHIHEDQKPSYRRVRSAAERQHRKLQAEANSAKKNTEKKCEKMEKQAVEKQAKLEAQKRDKQKELEKMAKKTEDIFNQANHQADESLQKAQETNNTEHDKIKHKTQKSSKPPRTQTKTEETSFTDYAAEETERRETYRQWQKRKADDLHKRLLLAYSPYLPADLFSKNRKSQEAKLKAISSRPTTSYSYNSAKSGPASNFSKQPQRETTQMMTTCGSRKIVTANGIKENNNQAARYDASRRRNPLVFRLPNEYETIQRERKQIQLEYIQQKQQQQQQQRPVEVRA